MLILFCIAIILSALSFYPISLEKKYKDIHKKEIKDILKRRI